MATLKTTPDPEPQTVAVVMTVAVRWAESDRSRPRDYAKGSTVELPRALACQWWLLAWCEPAAGVTFSLAERLTAGAVALDELEAQRRNRGGDEVGWWRIPANARALAWLDSLTRAEAPGGDAA